MNDWFDITQAKPMTLENVLVAIQGRTIAIGRYLGDEDSEVAASEFEWMPRRGELAKYMLPVTHWMRLPKPPTMGNRTTAED